MNMAKTCNIQSHLCHIPSKSVFALQHYMKFNLMTKVSPNSQKSGKSLCLYFNRYILIPHSQDANKTRQTLILAQRDKIVTHRTA